MKTVSLTIDKKQGGSGNTSPLAIPSQAEREAIIMSDTMWIEMPDGSARLAIEITSGLRKLRFFIKKSFTLSRRREGSHAKTHGDDADTFGFYLTEEGFWIKVFIDENEDGYFRSKNRVHPIEVAYEYRCVGKKPPVEIDSNDVAVADDKARYIAWIRGPERKAWSTNPFVPSLSTTDGGCDKRERKPNETSDCGVPQNLDVPTKSDDWIIASQAAICRALGHSGHRAKALEYYKSQGIISKYEKVSTYKWRVIFTNPVQHAQIKAAVTPKPRQKKS